MSHHVSFKLRINGSTYTHDQAGRKAATLEARLTIEANLSPPLVLEFFSEQYYDLEIVNDAGEDVARWSAGKVFPMTATNMTIQGQKQWDVAMSLADVSGKPLPAGLYVVKAFLTTHTEPFIRKPRAFAPLQHAASLAFAIVGT
jgi:hypothetical protein